MALRESITFRI